MLCSPRPPSRLPDSPCHELLDSRRVSRHNSFISAPGAQRTHLEQSPLSLEKTVSPPSQRPPRHPPNPSGHCHGFNDPRPPPRSCSGRAEQRCTRGHRNTANRSACACRLCVACHVKRLLHLFVSSEHEVSRAKVQEKR
jgi:hypothetical protein